MKTFIQDLNSRQLEPQQVFPFDEMNILYLYNEYRWTKSKRQKSILRIIEIKKLISNSVKQVWTCKALAINEDRLFYLRPF